MIVSPSPPSPANQRLSSTQHLPSTSNPLMMSSEGNHKRHLHSNSQGMKSPSFLDAVDAEHERQQRSQSLSPSLLYAKAGLTLYEEEYRKAQLRRSSLSMQPISDSEYMAAPRVVRMQVPLDVVRSATEVLNRTLLLEHHTSSTLDRQHPVALLGEHEVRRVLHQSLELDDRTSKAVLMALCHWRRLKLRPPSLPSSQAKLFEVIP